MRLLTQVIFVQLYLSDSIYKLCIKWFLTFGHFFFDSYERMIL